MNPNLAKWCSSLFFLFILANLFADTPDTVLTENEPRTPTYGYDSSGRLRDVTGLIAPAGIISLYAGLTVPDGWLLCDGSAVSRTGFRRLFAAIGTTCGIGDGSTTFNLPDFRSRAPIGAGQGSGLSNFSLGQSTGAETMTSAQMPSHTHTLDYRESSAGGTEGKLMTANGAGGAAGSNFPTASSGTGAKFRPPELAVNFIIKT